MELWDIYDIDRNKTDRTMTRGAEFAEGDYHLVIHVCIFNSKGEMLFSSANHLKKAGRICGISLWAAAQFREIAVRQLQREKL